MLTIFPSYDADAPSACGEYFPIQAQELIALLAHHRWHIADVDGFKSNDFEAERLGAPLIHYGPSMDIIPVIPIAVGQGVPETELPEAARQQGQFAPGEVIHGLYVVAPATIIAAFTGIAR